MIIIIIIIIKLILLKIVKNMKRHQQIRKEQASLREKLERKDIKVEDFVLQFRLLNEEHRPNVLFYIFHVQFFEYLHQIC